MTVIVIASPKGGVGKTTISILLAEQFAHMGWNVGVVESDKLQHIKRYNTARMERQTKENFVVYTDNDPDTIGSTIKKSDTEHEITIVDLPGRDGQVFTRAAARANLVLIPMAPSVGDHTGAVEVMRQVAIEEEHLERSIPHRIVLNMVKNAALKEKAIGVDKVERSLREVISQTGYPRLNSEVTDRKGVFKQYYAYAQTIPELAEDGNSTSIQNSYREIADIANEIIEILGATISQEGAVV